MDNLDVSAMSADDAAIILLRRCGHFLHHSVGKDSGKSNAELLSAFSDEEKKALAQLLQKCLESWQSSCD